VADRVTVRFETAPGKQGQVDWGTFRKPGLKRVQAFVLTLGWSRASYLDFSEPQALPTLLRCHEYAIAPKVSLCRPSVGILVNPAHKSASNHGVAFS
jgi:transposase